MRIPAFEAGEEDVIDVFLHPERAPYYGSYHLLVFDLLHPDLFSKYGAEVKRLFKDTYYQWVKNGNFSVIYGAQDAKADWTYRVPGARRKIKGRFPRITALADQQIALARERGWVETMPDKDVDPDRGYPIRVDGRPTTPLNYQVSGTACWWMGMAMIRCEEALAGWRAAGFDGFMAAQVHDELVFDLPRRADPIADPLRSNLGRVKKLAGLMERGGQGIGVPTPVAIEYHPQDWAKGLAL